MLPLALERGLFRLELNTPALPPLFQLPPRIRHRKWPVPKEKQLLFHAGNILAQQAADFCIVPCPCFVLVHGQRRGKLRTAKVFVCRHPHQIAHVIAQQQQSQAKVILDKTAEAFRKAGGVKADFTVKAVANGLVEGAENGTIQLKGEKFVLKTSDIITWFDGKTQWSYVTKNDEVNVSNPTQEELQQINPYTFLYMYQKGFSYKLGATKTFRGKSVWEVVLTARDKKQELERITLFVTKDTYEPLYILLQQRGQQTRNEITVTSYQTGQNYTDRVFTFDKKQYPNAEVIDLRY